MNHTNVSLDVFKTCYYCERSWENRKSFLSDPFVHLVGYQPHFEDLKTGMFLFNHKCGNTLAFKVEDFRDLYKGPVFNENKQGTDECSGFCLQEDNFQACPIECECAFVREIIQIIEGWEKIS